MATTKSDSKSNLNESTLPLLDDDKEKIELKAKEETGAQESAAAADNTTDAEKAEKEKAAEEAKRKKEEEKERKRKLKQEEEEKKKQAKLEKQKKKEEEKELKKQKKEEKKAAAEAAKVNGGAAAGETSGRPAGAGLHPLCSIGTFTAGLNLLDRDERSINEHVNVNFEDVLGEPDATQGFEGAYRLSYGLFQFVRFWVYRILMAVVAIPLALVWGVVFALLSVFSVWVLTPTFRVVEVAFYFFHRLWNTFVRTILDPVFSSIALVRSSAHPFHRTPVATYSGRVVAANAACCSGQYRKVPTEDVAVSYKKSESDDDVTDKQITLNIENL